tara:strand:+ start:1906 stop:2370 length:465 start_codon:yes stop_codon:yes gene_type:complete
MIIESVAAAGMILQQINTVIQQVNEGKANVEKAMGLISDFGEGLNEFQASRQGSAFKALSNNDVLKLQMIRRSQERFQKDLRDLLLIADPKLLADYDAAIAENNRRHKEHLQYMARKKKQRDALIQQILVGGTTLIIGGVLTVGVFLLVLKAFT